MKGENPVRAPWPLGLLRAARSWRRVRWVAPTSGRCAAGAPGRLRVPRAAPTSGRCAAGALALGLLIPAAAAAAPGATYCDGAIARAVLGYLREAAGWPWTEATREGGFGAWIGGGTPTGPQAPGLLLLAEACWRGSPELPRTALHARAAVPAEAADPRPCGVFPGPPPGPAPGWVVLASGQDALAGVRDGTLARAELPTPLFRTLTRTAPLSDLVASPAAPLRFGIWVPAGTRVAERSRWLAALAAFEGHPRLDAVLVALGADSFRAPRAGPEPPGPRRSGR